MASSLWSYWSAKPPPTFPQPPANPLTYIFKSPEKNIITEQNSAIPPPSGPYQLVHASSNGRQDERSQMVDSGGLEVVDFSRDVKSTEREENSEYRLLLKRYFGQGLVPGAIQRWRDALTWLPIDVPAKLELGPIQAYLIPYYVFSAKLESTCSGKYDMHDGTEMSVSETEVRLLDELNEILVCATTDVHPLIEELFSAKAFTPPPSRSVSPPPLPSIKHPYHKIRYREHLFANSLVEGAQIAESDIPVELASNMICDYLVNDAGPFLATQEFKTRFGQDSREIVALTTVKSLLLHHLLLPIYITTYTYHTHTYTILVSGVNGHVAGQRMTWGTGSVGQTIASVGSSISKLVSNNI